MSVAQFIKTRDGEIVSTANIKRVYRRRNVVTIEHNDGGIPTRNVFRNDSQAAAAMLVYENQLIPTAPVYVTQSWHYVTQSWEDVPTVTAISGAGVWVSHLSEPANSLGYFLVQGTNFKFGGCVSIGGVVLSTTMNSATELLVSVNQFGLTTGAGTFDVVYTGPDAQTSRLANGWTVT